MEQLAGNWLAEAEMMFLPEFDHAPNGFQPRGLPGGGVSCWWSGGALNEGKEVLLQAHAAGPYNFGCGPRQTCTT